MAADSNKLSDQRRVSGAALLKLTDDVGFGALGAGWLLDDNAQTWRYLLVSPMIDSKGPRWVYERLLQVFRKTKLPEGITPLDIVIVSPRQIGFRNFPIRHSGDDGVMHLTDMTVDGLHIGYMALYRMLPMKNDAGERAKTFESRVRELVAA